MPICEKCHLDLEDAQIFWCPQNGCPRTSQREPTPQQRKLLGMDRPFAETEEKGTFAQRGTK